jgi:hypothetical protein
LNARLKNVGSLAILFFLTCRVGEFLDIHGWKAKEAHGGAKDLAPQLGGWRLTASARLRFRPVARRLTRNDKSKTGKIL